MTNQNLLRGLVLVAIALLFGLGSLRYPLGELDRAGPGLFPLVVSSILFLLGVATLVRSFAIERAPFDFKARNIVIIVASLGGFALLSEYINMTVGIIFLAFCAPLAGTSYSLVRNLKIAAGLVAVAFAFYKLLGVQLPLY